MPYNGCYIKEYVNEFHNMYILVAQDWERHMNFRNVIKQFCDYILTHFRSQPFAILNPMMIKGPIQFDHIAAIDTHTHTRIFKWYGWAHHERAYSKQVTENKVKRNNNIKCCQHRSVLHSNNWIEKVKLPWTHTHKLSTNVIYVQKREWRNKA